MKIRRVNWGEVREERPSWSPASGRLYAIWPSPVNRDQCFEAAGFTDFANDDDDWDDDFPDVVRRLIEALGGTGSAVLTEGKFPVTGLFRRSRSVVDALLAAADHDNYPPCVVTFGAPPIASVRTMEGHELLWIWLADGGEIGPIVSAVAQGREVTEMTMRWENLA